MLIIRPELWQSGGIINLVTFSEGTNRRSDRQPGVPGLESHCPKLSFPSLEPSVDHPPVQSNQKRNSGSRDSSVVILLKQFQRTAYMGAHSSFGGRWLFTQKFMISLLRKSTGEK